IVGPTLPESGSLSGSRATPTTASVATPIAGGAPADAGASRPAHRAHPNPTAPVRARMRNAVSTICAGEDGSSGSSGAARGVGPGTVEYTPGPQWVSAGSDVASGVRLNGARTNA